MEQLEKLAIQAGLDGISSEMCYHTGKVRYSLIWFKNGIDTSAGVITYKASTSKTSLIKALNERINNK